MPEERERNVNPPHVVPPRESPEVTKARLFLYHRRNGSMEHYYEQYPMDRPPSRGRGR